MSLSRSAITVSVFTVVTFLIIEELPFAAPRIPAIAALTRNIPEEALFTFWKLIWVVLCVLCVVLAQRCSLKEALRDLGLLAPVRIALTVAFVAAAPMLVLAAVSPLNPKLNGWALLQTTVGSGLGEELLFRGYLFGQLYRRARWPFWAAALISALPFALAHLYQHQETGLSLLAGLAEVLVVVGLSAMLAAWLFVRWKYNLWLLVGFHGLANLWWYLWGEGQEQIYGWLGNVLRVSTIVLAVAVTLLKTRPTRDGVSTA